MLYCSSCGTKTYSLTDKNECTECFFKRVSRKSEKLLIKAGERFLEKVTPKDTMKIIEEAKYGK